MPPRLAVSSFSIPRSSRRICRTCRRTFATVRGPLLAPSDSITERLRKKIWGTETPPGLKDPYGGPSKLEKWRAKNKTLAAEVGEQDVREAHGEDTEIAASSDAQYVPATTWDGLEHVGGSGQLWYEQFDMEEPFKGFITPVPHNDPRLLSLVIPAIVRDVLAHHAKGLALSDVFATPATTEQLPASYFTDSIPSLSAPIPSCLLFTILKRITQLTGLLTPDVHLTVLMRTHKNSLTTQHLISLFTPRKEPEKLASVLTATALSGLANVDVGERRQRPEDHERKIGRQKLIDAELKQRQLDVDEYVPEWVKSRSRKKEVRVHMRERESEEVRRMWTSAAAVLRGEAVEAAKPVETCKVQQQP